MKCKIVIENSSDGYFVAECVTLPGCISQGKTLKSALSNLGDAMEGYWKSLRKHNEKIPEVV